MENAAEYLNTLKEDVKEEELYCNILIAGAAFSGKTTSLETLPRPLLIETFDSTGSTVLKQLKKEKDVFINQYYPDDPSKPTQFKNWASRFDKMKLKGVFDYLETYAIDSLTSFAKVLLNQIIADVSRTGKRPIAEKLYNQPILKDYGFQTEQLLRKLEYICGLPCHFVLTAHVLTTAVTDSIRETTEIIKTLLIGPKTAAKMPQMFHEVYIARQTKLRGFHWVTSNDRDFDWCGSRWSREELLNKEEPQDFKNLFAKVGIPFEGKSLPKPKKEK